MLLQRVGAGGEMLEVKPAQPHELLDVKAGEEVGGCHRRLMLTWAEQVKERKFWTCAASVAYVTSRQQFPAGG